MGEFPDITWDPSPHGKGTYSKRYLTFHNTSNNASPTGECNWNRNRTDGIGFHFVGDPSDFRQGLWSYQRIGHVGSDTGNSYGISFEMVGYNSSGAEYWQRVLDRCAPGLREVMAKYGIPPVWLTIEQMRDGRSKGLITHDMARIAWPGGTDHTDPGPNFPKAYAATVLGGTSAPKPPATPSPDRIEEDGRLGPQTVSKWQRVMGTTVDGHITQPPGKSSLIMAVQRKLNAVIGAGLAVDGQGIQQGNKTPYKTTRALQRYLGTPQDGILSAPVSQAVKELQRRLNRNSF